METKINHWHGADVVLREDESRLHDLGGETVCSVIVKRADGLEARFWLRVFIPDDPRGGVEGDCHAVLTAHGRGDSDVVKVARGVWHDYREAVTA